MTRTESLRIFVLAAMLVACRKKQAPPAPRLPEPEPTLTCKAAHCELDGPIETRGDVYFNSTVAADGTLTLSISNRLSSDMKLDVLGRGDGASRPGWRFLARVAAPAMYAASTDTFEVPLPGDVVVVTPSGKRITSKAPTWMPNTSHFAFALQKSAGKPLDFGEGDAPRASAAVIVFEQRSAFAYVGAPKALGEIAHVASIIMNDAPTTTRRCRYKDEAGKVTEQEFLGWSATAKLFDRKTGKLETTLNARAPASCPSDILTTSFGARVSNWGASDDEVLRAMTKKVERHIGK